MTTTYKYSQIWTIAYPILLSTLMEQLIGMTDTAFLGRVGEIELGASALGGIFYVTVFMLGLGFSIGAQILMARRNGEGKYLRIGSIFYHSLVFLFVLALVLFILTRQFAPLLLHQIINSPRVFEATNDYLNWRICGIFFAFGCAMFRAFYVATTKTRVLTLNSIILVVSNIFLNYCLIFGHLGCPALGISGAAIGSTLAGLVSLLFFIVHTFTKVDCARYGLNRLPHFRFSVLRKLLNISIWTMLQNFLSLATWFFFFLAVEHLGEQDLAATNVIRNLSSISFMTVIAFATTSGTLVSNLMGQGRVDEVFPLIRKIIRLTFLILVPFLLVEALFPELFMGIFTDNVTLLEVGRPALYVMLSSYVFTIPGQILFHTVSGTGNTKRSLQIEFLSLFIYCIYIAVALFQFRLSLSWGWASEHIYHFMAFTLCSLYLRRGTWRTTRI